MKNFFYKFFLNRRIGVVFIVCMIFPFLSFIFSENIAEYLGVLLIALPICYIIGFVGNLLVVVIVNVVMHISGDIDTPIPVSASIEGGKKLITSEKRTSGMKTWSLILVALTVVFGVFYILYTIYAYGNMHGCHEVRCDETMGDIVNIVFFILCIAWGLTLAIRIVRMVKDRL